MKKNIKKLALLLAALNIAISVNTDDVYASGSKRNKVSSYSDGWHCNDGQWIYVKDGAMKTNWFKDNDGSWYYFNHDGIMQTGWILDNNNWYYLYGDGKMAHECYIGDYYLNDNGAWTNSLPVNIVRDNNDVNSAIKNIGYSSVERIIDYDSSDSKYSSMYRYIWYDGMEGNEQYAAVNVFDSGSCTISLRKNGNMFNDNLKKIFECVLPGNGQRLLDEISDIKEDRYLNIDGKNITIKILDDSIGIIIE